MPIKHEIAQNLTGNWKVGLCQAPCASPHCCLYGCCCTCCAVYQQRMELLDLTGEPYVCCAGDCEWSPFNEPMDRSCMCLEALCCTPCALDGNREMVETRFNKKPDACDECILWTVCLCDCVVCLASCCVEVPPEIRLCMACINQTTSGCMHAQQHVEIQEIKKNGYQKPSPEIIQTLPPLQQKMIQEGKNGGGGMPVQPYGAPYGGGGGSGAYGGQDGGAPPPQQMQ